MNPVSLKYSLSRKMIVLLVVFGLFHTSYSQNKNASVPRVPLIHNFNSEDYQGGVQNWDITQDKRGIVYVANNFGLLEFDGNNWDINYLGTGKRVLSVLIHEDGRIYIGGQNKLGYLKQDDENNLRYVSLIDLIPYDQRHLDNVWKVCQYEQYIVFNSGRYNYFFDGKNMQVKAINGKGKNLFQVNSQLLALDDSKGLLLWNGRDFEVLSNHALLLQQNIVKILPNVGGGYLIFLSDGKIYELNDNELKRWKNDASTLLEESLINTAVILDNNSIAIGTQNKGLVIISSDGGIEMVVSKSKGLNSNTIYAIYQDQFHNIWLGLSNGLTCINYGSPFSLIDDRIGLPGTGYTATKSQSKIYLGTNNGLFNYDLENKNAVIENEDRFNKIKNSSGQVYSIASYGKKLLMGHHLGAYEVRNNEAKKVYSSNGTWRFAITPKQKGYIAGTYTGFIGFDSEFKSPNAIKNFRESSRLFHFKNDSTLWMSHGFKGVYKLGFDEDYSEVINNQYYGIEQGFPSTNLINVFKINNQFLFAAEKGLYVYDENKDRFEQHHKLQEALGGSEEHISYMASNHMGDIYYIKENKFGVLKKDRFGEFSNEEKSFMPINKYLLTDDLENINIIDHETILIGAKNGFIHYNSSITHSKNKDFYTLIRKIKLNYEDQETIYNSYQSEKLNNIILSSKLKSITFQYAAPYLDGFSDLEYQYKLKGFDQEWSEFSKMNVKEYTNLPFGEYEFMVRSKNIYGDISQIASSKFTIDRPWYLSPYSIISYVIMTILTFLAVLLWMSRSHKNDKKQLLIDQEKVILQKEQQIENVSKESEEEISKLKNEKLKSMIEFKTKELAASTMHLLNKNKVMMDIKSKLESIVKAPSPKPNEIKQIIKSIDRNISEDKDWDQFTIHFDQVHDDFFKKLKEKFPALTPQEMKMAAYLRMNLTSKDIAQLLNISIRGVEVSRYRLRKKLDLNREINLVTFIMDI